MGAESREGRCTTFWGVALRPSLELRGTTCVSPCSSSPAAHQSVQIRPDRMKAVVNDCVIRLNVREAWSLGDKAFGWWRGLV